jgi:hypothetical protein
MRALIAPAVIALIVGSVAFRGPAHAQKSQLGTSPAGGHKVEPHAPEARPPRRTRARTRGESRNLQTGDMDSVGRRIERWKPVPVDHKRTPDQGSPGWTREQTEAAEKDRVLDRKIRSICRGCRASSGLTHRPAWGHRPSVTNVPGTVPPQSHFQSLDRGCTAALFGFGAGFLHEGNRSVAELGQIALAALSHPNNVLGQQIASRISMRPDATIAIECSPSVLEGRGHDPNNLWIERSLGWKTRFNRHQQPPC